MLQQSFTSLRQDICWEFDASCGDSNTTVIATPDIGYQYLESGKRYETNRTFGFLNTTQLFPYTGLCAIDVFVYSPAGNAF